MRNEYMFKNLKAPFQPSEESETGVFILAGIRAPYHKTNSQPFPIPDLVFDGRATPEEIALLEKVRQTEEETGILHEN
ncbi:MAG: hypothetical protein D8H97_20730 [Neisseria sp.]|nr:MAG: hypothetical protein D8H97_20730 [Neisseria sp.]